jgi:hypothetical protein
MLDIIATNLGVTPSVVQSVLVFAGLTAICGTVLYLYWRIVIIGVIASACLLAFLKSNNNPKIPQILSNVVTGAASSVPVTTEFSKAKSDYLNSCVGLGHNKEECLELWAESQYNDQQKQGEAREKAVAASAVASAATATQDNDSN